jgi:chorismate mutase / prephenate dehydratase
LRAELDRIDDELHTLLMQRAEVVEHVARAGKPSAFRPGREASIIRRLLRQHSGALPGQTLVRIWRELLAGTTAMQGQFSVAVCEPDGNASITQAAREHFGALTPLRVLGSPAQAMAEVSRGAAAVAVLPAPSETEVVRDAWWTALLQKDEPRIHVVARLPFWAPRPDGAPTVQALVIAAGEPDASDHDCSLLGLELDLDVSRARLTAALTAAGLSPGMIILRRDQGAQVAHALIEVDGFLADEDPRLAGLGAMLRRPVVLGAYAIPETGSAA